MNKRKIIARILIAISVVVVVFSFIYYDSIGGILMLTGISLEVIGVYLDDDENATTEDSNTAV